MKLDIQDLKDRLDVLEGTPINSINEQISAINTSISDLKEMDESLDVYIKALETTATDLQIQIDDANAEIAKVEGELGEDMSALEQSMLNELNTAKEAIEAALLAINNTLAELKQADEALDKKISDLLAYVDTQLTSTTDWAEATFSTLAQYEQTQTEISTIKASIEQINAGVSALETRLNGKIVSDIQTAIDPLRSELSTDYIARIENAVNAVTLAYTTAISSAKDEIISAYTNAIAKAMAESETSMKAWVNTLLAQGYYTISDIDGKVSALEALISDGDSNLQNQINEQKAALQQAKADLTNEYKQYINQAIASGGIIDQAIASQVKKAQDALQAQIDVINERLDSLEDRIGKLEEDFVNRIQSFKYIPEFSDGKARMSDFYKTISLDFLVSPSNQAKAVQNACGTNQDVVTAFLRCTKNPETKAISPAVQLLVTSVVGNADGTLNVTLKEDSANPIDTDFFTGDSDAVVYIQISDGNSDIFSDMVEIKSCIELSVYEDLSPLVNGVYKTANCYIVTKAGSYKFKAYKGNSQELAGSSESAVHPIGVINHAKVLWESFGTEEVPTKGDLINVADYEDGYVVFETPDQYREGNAVIAVRDESGNVLWSWHIWLTDQPQEQVYYNNAGTMMDRNLGATSTTPGDPLTWGLIYQWGRKDPFTDSSGSGTIYVQPSRDNSILQATLFPNHIIGNTGAVDSHLDWFAPSAGKLLWSHSQKTIYDPCPSGWRIPKYDVWKIATNSSVSSMECATVFDGMNLSTKLGADRNIWYPGGKYWSSYSNTVDFAKVFDINCNRGKIVFYDSTYMGTVQHYVRCAKE